MITKRFVTRAIFSFVLLFVFHHAFAAIPTTLDYQGFLTDTAGVPVDGPATIDFSVYNVELGGSILWSETHAVTVNQGVFSVELGATVPFPVGLFEQPLWLELQVGADAAMTPRRPVTSTGFAFKAEDANRLEGMSASSLDQSAHVGDTGNPHGVTAAQVGAISGIELSTHAADASAHHAKTTSFTDLTDTATDAQIPDDITIDQSTNADSVNSLNASSTPVAGQLLALDGGGKFPNSTLVMGPGSGLDADTVDGQHASDFLNPAADYGRFGVTSDLYEGTQTLANKYVNAAGDTMTGPLIAVGLGLPTSFGPDPLYVGTTGNYISFGHSGVSEDFIGYANNSFYFMDSLGGGDITGPDVIVGGRLGIGENTTPFGAVTVNSHIADDTGSYVNGLVFTNDIYLPENGAWTQAAIWSDGKPGYRGELVFGTDGDGDRLTPSITEHMRITENGRVGIGTSTPSSELDVNGDINASTINGDGQLYGVSGINSLNANAGYLGAGNAGVWGVDGSPGNVNTYAGVFDGNVKITGDFNVIGRTVTQVLEITGGADLSEQFRIGNQRLEPAPGMIVSIDPDNAGALIVSDHAYNRRVAGVISGAGDVAPGMIMGHNGTLADGDHPVALTGRVYCFAETSGGAIEPGDLLTTSDIPGYAMKVSDYEKAQGAIIGKAMTGLETERGQVLVLVSLQ